MEEDKQIKFKKNFRMFFKLVSYSLILFLMVISSFLIYYVVSSKIYKSNGNNPPFGLYTIVSSSMEPTINVYDVVFIKNVEVNKLKKDDIITFYSSNPFFGNTPITHRIEEVIVEDNDIMFKVKGDANEIADEELVLSSNILGRVYFRIPALGKLQFFIASKWGILVVVLIPAISIIVYDIYKLIKTLKFKRELKEIEELENA